MSFIPFLLISLIVGFTKSHPTPVDNMGTSVIPPGVTGTAGGELQLPPSPENRGLYSSFYSEKMQESKASASQVFAGEGAVTNINIQGNLQNAEDFGEKLTHKVLQTAVALADTGIEVAQGILKTVGSEIVEAFKM